MLKTAYLLMFFPLFATAVEIYQWFDEAGNIHFGNIPPTHVEKRMLEIRPAPGPNGDSSVNPLSPEARALYKQIKQREKKQERQRQAASKAEARKRKAKRTEKKLLCASLSKEIMVLRDRIRRTGSGGKSYRNKKMRDLYGQRRKVGCS
jgi:hypothetical protein